MDGIKKRINKANLKANLIKSFKELKWYEYVMGAVMIFIAARAMVQGFSVQVAQFIGAKKILNSRDTFRQGLIFVMALALLFSGLGIYISPELPGFLGATPEIYQGSYEYFLVFMIGIPVIMLRILATSMLQCSGSMKSVSFFNSIMCVLDILFNFMFIFPSRYISVAGVAFWVPGLGYGVMGAAIGSVAAEGVTAAILSYLAFMRSNYLRQTPILPWQTMFPLIWGSLSGERMWESSATERPPSRYTIQSEAVTYSSFSPSRSRPTII